MRYNIERARQKEGWSPGDVARWQLPLGLNAIIGHTHVVVAKHLLGIEAESKKGGIELLKE